MYPHQSFQHLSLAIRNLEAGPKMCHTKRTDTGMFFISLGAWYVAAILSIPFFLHAGTGETIMLQL